jgi:hypothetical protein
MPDVENDAPRLANACGECGDCHHPVIGPNTDGEPCDWCRDCGCNADQHTRMTSPVPRDMTRRYDYRQHDDWRGQQGLR